MKRKSDDDDNNDEAFDDDEDEAEDEWADGSPPILRHPFSSERINRVLARVFKKNPLANIEEANAFMEKHMNGRRAEDIVAAMKDETWDNVEEAQELMFQSMESDSDEEAFELAQRAIALDPNNPDAGVFFAMEESLSADEAIIKLREVIKRAEAALGEEFMRENKGRFWGNILTRPDMRARDSLVHLLVREGRYAEAVAEAEAMLELNPDDNQGVRDWLLSMYLIQRNCGAARDLINRYKESCTAVQAWAIPLENFLSDNKKEARKAVRKAIRVNEYVADYLLNLDKLPAQPPYSYVLGTRAEAVYCLSIIGRAWVTHGNALDWLYSVFADYGRG